MTSRPLFLIICCCGLCGGFYGYLCSCHVSDACALLTVQAFFFSFFFFFLDIHGFETVHVGDISISIGVNVCGFCHCVWRVKSSRCVLMFPGSCRDPQLFTHSPFLSSCGPSFTTPPHATVSAHHSLTCKIMWPAAPSVPHTPITHLFSRASHMHSGMCIQKHLCLECCSVSLNFCFRLSYTLIG